MPGIQGFGNAFKQAVAESTASNKRKQQIYPRNRASDKIAGSAEILGQTYNYPDEQNVERGSVVIDA